MKEKNKNEKIVKTAAFAEIVVLIVAIFSFAYLMNAELVIDVNEKNNNSSSFEKIMYDIVKFIFNDKNLVSATELTDDQMTIWRQQFPPGSSDADIIDAQHTLENIGAITADKFSDPVAIQAARAKGGSQLQDILNRGGDLGSLQAVYDFLHPFLPSTPVGTASQITDVLNGATGGGIYTCEKTKNGGPICQQFAANQCANVCDGACIQKDRYHLPLTGAGSECKLGVCYDANAGTCSPSSPQKKCTDDGGTFLDYNTDKDKIVQFCTPGCCLLGTNAQWINYQQCKKIIDGNGQTMGDNPGFHTDIDGEPACKDAVAEQKSGACVLKDISGVSCIFTQKKDCDERSGAFNENKLCTNDELKNLGVQCTKEHSTGCADGLDEVYWYDSCGNRENIIEGNSDAQKMSSWNNGLVKPKAQSCVVGDVKNPVKNQASCGNCNRFLGSVCGKETDNPKQELDDSPDSGFVCKDLSCVDASGKRRQNGESWCAYQSSIGLPGPDFQGEEIILNALGKNPIAGILGIGARSTDTPGSRNFQVSCISGEITTTACGTYRNEICSETQTDIGNGEKISQAACRLNRWQECLNYNHGPIEGQVIGTMQKGAAIASKLIIDARCMPDPDCFVKEIKLDDFAFSYCLPRYNPGFELNQQDGQSLAGTPAAAPAGSDAVASQVTALGNNLGTGRSAADKICSQAKQDCTTVWVLTLDSGWTCKENCACIQGTSPMDAQPSREFISTMNEMCTSLGDCGYKTNYIGTPAVPGTGFKAYTFQGSGNFASYRGFLNLPTTAIDSLFLLHPQDAEPTPNEYVKAYDPKGSVGRWSQISQMFNLDALVSGLANLNKNNGGNGEVNLPGTHENVPKKLGLITGATGGAVLVGGWSAFQIGTTFGIQSLVDASSPATMGFSGALIGAGLGMAITAYILDWTGVGRGLSPVETYALIGAGAVSGGIMAAGLLSKAGTLCAIGGGVGCIVAIVVIVIIAILMIIGIGKTQVVKVRFECLPWEAPLGSDEQCKKCGKDSLSDGQKTFTCDKYSCEALGQGCTFVAETEGPQGSNNNLCIYSPPGDVKAPKIIEMKDDALTKGFLYKEFSSSTGVKIVKDGANTCLNDLETVKFGFTLDKYGKCSVAAKNPATGEIKFEQLVPIASGPIDYTYSINSLMLKDLGFDGTLTKEQQNDIQLYIVCENYRHDNNIRTPFVVQMCVNPNDRTSATVDDETQPEWLSCNAENQDVSFTVDKKSECKWSYNDAGFAQMENSFDCQTQLSNGYYECRSNVLLKGNLGETTTIYRRCLDHPDWQGTSREGERNENQQSYTMSLKRTQSCLSIDSIKVNDNEATDGNSVVIRTKSSAENVFTITAATSGGVDGKAQCSIKFGDSPLTPFYDTGGTTHTQTIGQGTFLNAGDYELNVSCNDAASPPNHAEKNATFVLQVDDASPMITRVYQDSGNLNVITNEPSVCSYVTTNDCSFKVDDGNRIEISDGAGFRHITSFDGTQTYSIKCKDDVGNERGSQCDIVVAGGQT